ncbi:MAG: hypothetical protein V7731_03765 [Amphritea sp.]
MLKHREKAPVKPGRKGTARVGIAVCDMKGSLWELDAEFLGYMKEMTPGWSGGDLPEDVMATLKNTGCYQAVDMRLQAEPKGDGKVLLKLQKVF